MKEELCAMSIAYDAVSEMETLIADYVTDMGSDRDPMVNEVLEQIGIILNKRFERKALACQSTLSTQEEWRREGYSFTEDGRIIGRHEGGIT